MKDNKLPLGVFPKWIWLLHLEVPLEPSEQEIAARKVALQQAIDRYTQAGVAFKSEWAEELILHDGLG